MIIVKDMAHCCLVTRPNLSVLQFKWSRKGFMRTRWIVHNQYVPSTGESERCLPGRVCNKVTWLLGRGKVT